MFSNKSKENCETETKFVQERVLHAEKSFAELQAAFAAFSRRAAKLRDTGDELSSTLHHFADSESVNHLLSDGVKEFATTMRTMNSYADKRVQYIDNKIVAQLMPYEAICKNMKDGIKSMFATKDKQVLRQRQLDRIKERNPRNRPQIVKAESELVQAKADVSRHIHHLSEKLTTFERQKIQDLKDILLDFICTEIGFYCKVTALMTTAFKSVDGIDVDQDVEDLQAVFDELDPSFKSALRNAHKQVTSAEQRVRSKSMGILGKGEGIPINQPRKLTMNQRTKSEEILHDHDDNSINSRSVSLSDLSYSESEYEEQERHKRQRNKIRNND